MVGHKPRLVGELCGYQILLPFLADSVADCWLGGGEGVGDGVMLRCQLRVTQLQAAGGVSLAAPLPGGWLLVVGTDLCLVTLCLE